MFLILFNLILDIFLPWIVDLALHSSDGQIKITAYKLLQSIMLYMIGKNANNRSTVAVSFDYIIIKNLEFFLKFCFENLVYNIYDSNDPLVYKKS